MKKLFALLMSLVLLLSCVPALAETDGDTIVQNLLNDTLVKSGDPWLAAVANAGAQDIEMSSKSVSFTLCAFDAKPASLGAYSKAKDKAAWRQSLVSNLTAHSLKVTVKLKNGAPASGAAKSFTNTVKKAVKTSKSNLEKKDVAAALGDLFFPEPVSDKKVTADSFASLNPDFTSFISAHADVFPGDAAVWAPLFYLQDSVSLSSKNGPDAVALSWKGPDPAALLSKAYSEAIASFSAGGEAARPTEDQIPSVWQKALASAAVSMAKKDGEKRTALVDLSQLSGSLPVDYAAYFAGYTAEDTLAKVKESYYALPDYSAKDLPKTGKVTVASAKGYNVSIKSPADGSSAYIQFRSSGSNVVVSDVFIRSGEKSTVKIPSGNYIIQIATGSVWYGVSNLFGSDGVYSATDTVTIGKKGLSMTAGEAPAGAALHDISISDFEFVEDNSVTIEGTFKAVTPVNDSYPENPVIEGVSGTTGLPVSGEAYTPILMVLDNAEPAYPHWGVADADIVFQIPNAGKGATKLMALFADKYPEKAGPMRSGRMTMLPLAQAFDSAFAYAGPPAIDDESDADLSAMIRKWKMNSEKKAYNLLGGNYGERIEQYTFPHNLSLFVSRLHEDLVSKGVTFEQRPFLFTDEARTDGDTAKTISIKHYGESTESGANSASMSIFTYDPAKGTYTRTNSSGLYTDRIANSTVEFANLLVLRGQLSYHQFLNESYMFWNNHLVGTGCLEIFQNGHYVRGAWKRDSVDGRLILLDSDGSQLQLQRGKTFIVVTNGVTGVTYTH